MAAATRTRKSPAKRASKPQVDVYQEVTDRVIAMLEEGVVPWHKPWDDVAGGPMSISTKKPYRGINVLLLEMAAMTKGYHSPWWGTYNAIAERGGQVRRGEKGTSIILWKPKVIEDEETGKKKTIFFVRFYTVFNADQVDGEMNLPTPDPRPEVERIEACELALNTYYVKGGPSLAFGGNDAYYHPGTDHVQMPERAQFHSAERFYGAWFHETVHSTGHASRLNREAIVGTHRFGDANYSKEELVAELGALFMATRTGISATLLSNSAAYLQSWIKVLRGEPKLVVQAAQAAQKAVDLVMGELKSYDADQSAEAPAEEAVAVPA